MATGVLESLFLLRHIPCFGWPLSLFSRSLMIRYNKKGVEKPLKELPTILCDLSPFTFQGFSGFATCSLSLVVFE